MCARGNPQTAGSGGSASAEVGGGYANGPNSSAEAEVARVPQALKPMQMKVQCSLVVLSCVDNAMSRAAVMVVALPF